MEIIKQTVREFLKDDCPRMAAALSYYTVFSLPALLILVLMIAGVFADPEALRGQVLQQLQVLIGRDAAEQTLAILRNMDRPGGGGVLAVVLGVAALLFAATGAFAQLQATLNRVWEVEPDPDRGYVRNFLMKRVLSFGMILVIAFLLLVSLVLSTLLGAAGGTIASLLPAGLGAAALWAINLTLSLLVITFLFMAMYKWLPDAEIAWSDVWRGALATATLFVLGKFLLGFYISRSDPGSAYGAAGSLAILLVWVYYSAMIFFLGAEFTQVYANRHGSGIQPDDDAVRVVEETRRVP